MDERAWLVNVARGAHVHTDALVTALQEGAIGGAGLDVTDPEPLPDGHPLWSAPNCIITPHTADTWEMVVPLLAEPDPGQRGPFRRGRAAGGAGRPGGRLLNRVPAPWVLVCRRCGRVWALVRAGVALPLRRPVRPAGAAGPARCRRTGPWSLWRYRSVLPCRSAWERVTLGEGLTPLVPVRPGLWCKLDYVMPTGSFKDRGATVMMSVAAGLGVERVVADSSGNAGRAVAAYAARAGMAAEVYVPEATSPAQVAAMEGLGARVVVVAGDRAAAAEAARAAAERDRGLVRQPRLPARVRPRGQDPGLRAVRAARRPARDGGGARRQRHPGAGAVAGLPG